MTYTSQIRLLLALTAALGACVQQPGTALGQADRDRLSNRYARQINRLGPVRSTLRNQSLGGLPQSAYTRGYGGNVFRSNAATPTFPNSTPNFIPNYGGFPLDLSTPYYFPGSAYGQNPQPETGSETPAGGAAASAGRPNIRPRLDVGDRTPLSSNAVLADIRATLAERIEALETPPFSAAWYAAHPQQPALEFATDAPWRRPTWSETSTWLGLEGEPLRYDYRRNDIGLIYAYRNDSLTDRAVDLRETATELANQAISAGGDAAGLPLGVFAAIPPIDQSVETLFCLTLQPSGDIRGQQYDFSSQTVQPIHGAVDPASQRVAWRMGDDVAQTGLKNLTEDIARYLLFRADGWTQPWILMRMSSP